MWKHIRRVIHHPGLNVLAGIVMAGTALVEIIGEALTEALGVAIGAEHGLLAFGVLHTLKAIPEFVDGVAKIDEHRSAEPKAE